MSDPRIQFELEGDDQEQNLYFEESAAHSSIFKYLPWILLTAVIIGISFYAWSQYKKAHPESINALSDLKKLYGKEQPSTGLILPIENIKQDVMSAIKLYEKGNYVQAKMVFEKIKENASEADSFFSAYSYLGAIAFDQGKYNQALFHFKDSEKTNVNPYISYTNLAIVYRTLGLLNKAINAADMAKKYNPNKKNALEFSGKISADLGDHKNAINSYQESLKHGSNNAESLFQLSLSYIKSGQIAFALENLKKVITIAAKTKLGAQAHNQMGNIYYSRNEHNKAEYHYKQAIGIFNQEPNYHYNLGLVYLKINRFKEASISFSKAISMNSNSYELFFNIANGFNFLKDYNNAMTAINKSLLIHPSALQALSLQAELYYKQGNLQFAAETYTKIEAYFTQGILVDKAINNLGIIQMDQGLFALAEKTFKRALVRNPGSDEAAFNLGNLYKKLNMMDSALTIWQQIEAKSPHRIGILKNIADYYFEKGYYDEALIYYDKFLVKAENDPSYRIGYFQTLLNKALVYSGKKNWQLAEKNLLQLSSLELPSSLKYRVFSELALLYIHSKNPQVEKAKNFILKAVQLNPSDIKTRLLLAEVLMGTNTLIDREKAIAELTSITYNSKDTDISSRAYNLLGLLFYKNGENERALVAFQNALDINPGYKEAWHNKKLVQRRIF